MVIIQWMGLLKQQRPTVGKDPSERGRESNKMTWSQQMAEGGGDTELQGVSSGEDETVEEL